MAVTKRNANAQTFRPRWPTRSSLSTQQVRFTYDQPTDTLFVDFYGEARPAASIPLGRGERDYLFLRIDPTSEAVVGLQIEHFLSYAVKRHPELADALDFAALVGIDQERLRQIAQIDSVRTRRASVSGLLDELLRLSA